MDFVDFNLAKKLKEKGFPQHWRDQHYILENQYEDDFFEVGSKYPVDIIYDYIPTIAAPTIAQVLRWLREEKKIHVRTSVYSIGWCVDVTNMKGTRMYSSECEYQNYEQSVITGIEYVLNNLI